MCFEIQFKFNVWFLTSQIEFQVVFFTVGEAMAFTKCCSVFKSFIHSHVSFTMYGTVKLIN